MAHRGTSHNIIFPGNTPVMQPGNMLFSAPWYQFFWTLWERTGASAGDNAVASGSIIFWPGELDTIPAGYVLCDGSAVPREGLFAEIFEVIGTTYGAGNGTTTFNLPNWLNRVPIGAGDLYAVGATGGAASATLAIANLPPHDHPVTDPGHIHAVTDPGHVHTSLVAASNVTAGAAAGGTTAGNTGNSVTGVTVDSATTGVTVGNTGGGSAFDILPPYIAGFPIMKM